jgi:hypothetical protein
MFGNKDESIKKKIAGIDGLGGMTVNERLYLSGLIDEFDSALLNNRARAKEILTWLKVDEPSIDLIINHKQ